MGSKGLTWPLKVTFSNYYLVVIAGIESDHYVHKGTGARGGDNPLLATEMTKNVGTLSVNSEKNTESILCLKTLLSQSYPILYPLSCP